MSATGYDFTNWNVSPLLTNTDNPIAEVNISDFSATITANFSLKEYNFTINYNDSEGTVEYKSIEVLDGSINAAQHGELELLQAIPDTGYVFDGWVVNAGTPTFVPDDMDDPSINISLTDDAEITATFVEAAAPVMEIEQAGIRLIILQVPMILEKSL